MPTFKGEEVITGRRDGTESMFLDGHAQNQLYKYGEGRRHERVQIKGKNAKEGSKGSLFPFVSAYHGREYCVGVAGGFCSQPGWIQRQISVSTSYVIVSVSSS